MSQAKTMIWGAAALLAGLGALAAIGAAGAQNAKPVAGAAKPAEPAPPPQVPVGPDPGSTSASYGDWVLRCQRVGDGDKAQRLCEVAQTIQVQGQQGPVAQIAFGRLQASDPLRLTVALPPNVGFPSSVAVSPSDKDASVVDLQWRRCLPGGCIADAVLPADAIKALRGATAPGRLAFKDAAGRDIALPLSLRGFPQALDALNKG